jgi:hypothetical protein
MSTCCDKPMREIVTDNYAVVLQCPDCGRRAPVPSLDDQREQARQERVARIVGQTSGKVSTAALVFDYAEATAIAAGETPYPPSAGPPPLPSSAVSHLSPRKLQTVRMS